jgi:Domain of unknown function (DUF1844)
VVPEGLAEYTATVYVYARLPCMTPPEPEEPSFKVTDRRRRVQDEEPSPSSAPVPPHPDAQGAEGAVLGGRERTSAERPDAPSSARPDSARPSAPPVEPVTGQATPERDLTGLFVMLASSAAMALGEAPDPVTGEVHQDLGQASELIELLSLLRTKTEGNRSPSETQVLDEVLYELQLRYVASTRRGAPGHGPSRS